MKKLLVLILCIGIILLNTQVFADSYVMHTIQLGDTYWNLSKEYNKDINKLQLLNKNLGDILYAGSLIKIDTIKSNLTISVRVNNKEIYTEQAPYIENSRTFVPIRFVAEALDVENIKWSDKTKTATLVNNGKVIDLTVGSKNASINGNYVKLDAPINNYNDRVFVPLRFVCEAFDCSVDWDGVNYIVDIHSANNTDEDLYWLSRIVEAESSGEPYEGKLAVANIIINRKNSPEFPNSIKEVIFDKNFGIQFTPVLNGTIYNTPSAESIKVAKEALEGKNNIGSCLYFLNPSKAENFWIINNKTYYISINHHDFYM